MEKNMRNSTDGSGENSLAQARTKKLRDLVAMLPAQLDQLKQTVSAEVMEIDAAVEKTRKSLDSMSEMSTVESLKLQMAMDRMAKMVNTLSSLLRKMSDTQQNIVQNMK